jgi:NAD+ kinase
MIPPIRCIGLFANPARPEACDVIVPVAELLLRRGVTVKVEDAVSRWLAERGDGLVQRVEAGSRADLAGTVDVIVTFGGDGTMLAAAQDALPHSTPILGVNLGKLGFLADVNANATLDAIAELLERRCRIEDRMTLSGALAGSAEFHALNDIVISKGGHARIVHIDASVDGDFLATFLADGIIIATPTGSTAYSLATGGPIVVPSSDVIIISPISAHTLTARPIIVPGGSRVHLEARLDEGSILLMYDGRVTEHHPPVLSIDIRRGDRPLRLVKHAAPTYFSMLRKKLSWARDERFAQDAGKDGAHAGR